MKIIRYGNPKKIDEKDKVKVFSCRNCDCVFTANENDYETGSQYNDLFCYCKCPCFSKIVYRNFYEEDN